MHNSYKLKSMGKYIVIVELVNFEKKIFDNFKVDFLFVGAKL